MTDEVGDQRLKTKIPYTDKYIDTSDYYSLRDLFEAGVCNFGYMECGGDTYNLEVTFYDNVEIMNDYGENLFVGKDETINVSIDEQVMQDIEKYLRY